MKIMAHLFKQALLMNSDFKLGSIRSHAGAE